MARLSITLEMAGWIGDRLRLLAAEDSEVAAAGALPLYVDTRGVLAIRPDGMLVEWSRDVGARGARPVEDRTWMLIALAAGSRRYPELRGLLPPPGPGSGGCECRRVPECVSGLIACGTCGRLAWLADGESWSFPAPIRPRRSFPLFGLVFLALAFLSFLGAFAILIEYWRAPAWHGVLLIVLGVFCLAIAPRGIGRRPPDARKAAQGPTFDRDDPGIDASPGTSDTHLGEQVRRARERRQRAGDW